MDRFMLVDGERVVREMLRTWIGAGQPYYRPLPDTAERS